MKLSEITLLEKYIVRQNPSDKLWYALGSVGKYYMPVSDGKKNKRDAEKWGKLQPAIDRKALGLDEVS